MRALVIRGPGDARVEEVDSPVPGRGQVSIDVERVGICGTDVELFTGEMAYLHQGHAGYPLRPGHEWVGRVGAVGEDVTSDWLGRRVTSDTMLSCGSCDRCRRGRHHVCDSRYELGVRGGWPGALAERLVVPVDALFEVPESVSPAAAALVEPGAGAYRSVEAAHLEPDDRLLVFGPGTIGLLATQFAVARGAEVHVAGIEEVGLDLARRMGARSARLVGELAEPPDQAYRAVIDASTDPGTPAQALRWVEPAGRVILIGLAGSPSLIDTRDLTLADVTAVGILGGSAGIAATITAYATGEVVPDPLVAEVIGLDDVAGRLAGERGHDAGPGPKVQVDPRL